MVVEVGFARSNNAMDQLGDYYSSIFGYSAKKALLSTPYPKDME
jgi:hypothetical protein